VAAGGSCTISVTFTPTVSGPRSASISISDNATGSPQSVSLDRKSVVVGEECSSRRLRCPSKQVSTTSVAQTITVSNSGSAALSITGVGVTGTNAAEFSQSNTCGTSVAAGGSCTISVTFTPTVSGPRSASISISDNATGSPQSVSLTGKGVAPQVTLSVASLSFASLLVSTPSVAQSILFPTRRSSDLSITGVGVTGTNAVDFNQSNTCGTSVAAGGSCTISVTFTPTVSGT